MDERQPDSHTSGRTHASSRPTWLPARRRRRALAPPAVGGGHDQTGEPDLKDAEHPVVRPGLTDEVALGGLIWLLKKLIDWISGNDGDAAEPDIDWDDPDFTGYPGVTETTGDVVVTYGDWIMDTEHHEYFEIHPVRAYYLVASNSLGEDEPVLVEGNEGQVVVGPNFDPTRITAADAREMCAMVGRAEESDSDDVIYVESTRALSFGMATRYGGGGTMRAVD